MSASFSSWEQLDRQFRFLISRALPGEYGGALSLVLTCPKFPDSPIVAALTGFEAVCGYAPGSFIGRNCRFMNRGLKNQPETLSELKSMQESPSSARAFMTNNPKGKHYLMRNRRPARMTSTEHQEPSNSVTDDGKCYIEFFNLLHIFGLEVKREKHPKTPVLVGIQFVLTSGLNQWTTEKLTSDVQDLLMNPHSNIRHVFFDWCRLALSVYEEYNDWNERGNFNLARRETGDTNPLNPETFSLHRETIAALQPFGSIPKSPASTTTDPLSPARKDSFRFLPTEEFKLEFPSKSKVPVVQDHPGGPDEGEDSSTLAILKSPRAESHNSLDASSLGARSTPRRELRTDEKAMTGAKQLLDKIKEVEQMANEWAANNDDEKSGERVKELVTLREALCDDFAADLNLYIAFYCVSKELQEAQAQQASMVQA